MKTFKFITHPFILVISFLIIIISGQHLGGLYILYILLGLSVGASHSIMALFGIALLIFSFIKFGKHKNNFLKYIINLIGVSLLIISVFLFYYNDIDNYNRGTLYQLVPQTTLIVFGLFAVCFIVDNLISVTRNFKNTHLENSNPMLE